MGNTSLHPPHHERMSNHQATGSWFLVHLIKTAIIGVVVLFSMCVLGGGCLGGSKVFFVFFLSSSFVWGVFQLLLL